MFLVFCVCVFSDFVVFLVFLLRVFLCGRHQQYYITTQKTPWYEAPTDVKIVNANKLLKLCGFHDGILSENGVPKSKLGEWRSNNFNKINDFLQEEASMVCKIMDNMNNPVDKNGADEAVATKELLRRWLEKLTQGFVSIKTKDGRLKGERHIRNRTYFIHLKDDVLELIRNKYEGEHVRSKFTPRARELIWGN